MEVKALMVREPMFPLNDKAEKVAEHLHVAETLIHIIMQFSVSMATIREEFSPWRIFLSWYYWKAAIGTVLVICCSQHRKFKDVYTLTLREAEPTETRGEKSGKSTFGVSGVSNFAPPFTQFSPKTPQRQIGAHKLRFISPEQDNNERETILKE